MKKLLLAVLVVLATAVQAQAQNSKTLLWQITGPGIEKPSYLYGTIHIMCPNEIVVTGELLKRFNTTKKLYLELNLADPKTMTDAMGGMMMKGGVTIKLLLPGAKYDSVAHNFEKLSGVSLGLINGMLPMLAEAAIYPGLLGCAGEAWEKKFEQMAEASKISIHGLETVQDQMAVIDSIPYQMQADMLAKSLMNVDSLRASFKQLLDVYKSRDVDSLDKLMNEDPDFGKYENIMVNRRNAKWIPEIAAAAKLGPCFFAVGAGHLGGKKGVINMLRKKGYTVKPVMY